MSMSAQAAIDWNTAQRVGELIAGSPPYGGAPNRSAQSLAHDFARRVSAYTGLELPAELPPLEMVDRRSWIAANLLTMRPLLDPLVERLSGERAGEPAPAEANGAEPGGARADRSGPLSGALHSLTGPLRSMSGPLQTASGHMLGAQLGAVTGMLSQRVLGQYDVSLLDDATPPRLLLVAPNLEAAARNLNVERDELIAWVAIHEITHAVQFSGAPWLREHLGDMLRKLLDGMRIGAARSEPELASAGVGRDGGAGGERSSGDGGSGDRSSGGGGSGGGGSGGGPFAWLRDPAALLARARAGDLGDLPGMSDLRTLADRARRGELLRIGLGEERWQLVEGMQTTMSLIEGHAEHTMDAVGAEVLPSLPRLRAALTRRRASRGLPWRVLERILGLELKMRQYEVGRAFCDAVVEAGGPQLLAVVWRSPGELPSARELAEPARWIERVQVAA
jgi:putative hydrolase